MNAPHTPGPPTLSPGALRAEEQATLTTPRQRSHPVIVVMNVVISVLYGRRASLQKCLVLEHVAQVPYRSWERVAQRRITRTRGHSTMARRIQARVADARAAHDNEQWHMLILEDLLARRHHRLARFRFRILPRLLAGPWHLATWLLHLRAPAWSYALNAAFEDHAEREYMRFVTTNTQFEHQTFDGPLTHRWTHPVTVADVLRQIGHDERCHKLDSIAASRAQTRQQPALAIHQTEDSLDHAA
jgi:ubiquinol oxidase